MIASCRCAQAQTYAERQTFAAASAAEPASYQQQHHSGSERFATRSAMQWASVSRSGSADDWHRDTVASASQPPPLISSYRISPNKAPAIDSPFRTVAASMAAVQSSVSAAFVSQPMDNTRDFPDYVQHPADRFIPQHSAAAAAAQADLLRRLDGMQAAVGPRAFSGGEAAFGTLRPPSTFAYNEPSSEMLSRDDSRDTIDAIVPDLMERAERRRLLREAAVRSEATTQSMLGSPALGASSRLTAQMLQMVQYGEGLNPTVSAGPYASREPAAASPELVGRWVALPPLPPQAASASSLAGDHPGEHGDGSSAGTLVRSVGSGPRSRLPEAEASPAGTPPVPSPAASAPQLHQAPLSASPASSVRRLFFERTRPQQPAAGSSMAVAAPDAPVSDDKPSPFAVHDLQQRFRHPAVEAAFRRWQAENVFYKVRVISQDVASGCSFRCTLPAAIG